MLIKKHKGDCQMTSIKTQVIPWSESKNTCVALVCASQQPHWLHKCQVHQHHCKAHTKVLVHYIYGALKNDSEHANHPMMHTRSANPAWWHHRHCVLHSPGESTRETTGQNNTTFTTNRNLHATAHQVLVKMWNRTWVKRRFRSVMFQSY